MAQHEVVGGPPRDDLSGASTAGLMLQPPVADGLVCDSSTVEMLDAIAAGASSMMPLASAAVADDRDRIAQRLNDDVIYTLFGIGLRLQATAELVDDAPRHQLELAIHDLDLAIAEVRDVIFNRAKPAALNRDGH
jgi:signal transduction histidine kinase